MRYLNLIAAFILTSLAFAQDRPNILLIVADDLGYTDLGCFGSEIATPNIDALAEEGIAFTNFHTAPTCAPTRAMLFSGNDNHTAGMGSQFRKTGEYGYEGHLSGRIIPFPQLLRDNGYHTSITGKWHLGTEPEHNPANKGFEQSFALLLGAANHSDDTGFSDGHPISPYTENGQKTEWPKNRYSTDLYTDKLIEFIGNHKDDDQPFCAIATYTSPHWPLQVEESFWRKYEGWYSGGYETLRDQRLNGLKDLGIVPEETELPILHPSVSSWASLDSIERKREERKMELYAGMVENLDHHVGRIITFLRENQLYENTLIVFMSDNGAASRDFYHRGPFKEFIQAHYNNDYENMGKPNSFVSYGPPWAEAGTAAFRYYKDYTLEGGLRTPMIVRGPGLERQAGYSEEFISVMDLAPTFLDLAGINYPTSDFPMKGESIIPYLSTEKNHIHDEGYVFFVEQSGAATIIQDGWKLVSMREETWEFNLYRPELDLSESKDLSSEYPEIRAKLDSVWLDYKKKLKILDP